MKPVLILVDLQNDFLSAKGLVPSAGMVIGNSAVLLDFCRKFNIPVVHVFTTVSQAPDSRMPHWKEQERWICVEGTAGHDSPASLDPQDGEQVIHKRFFSAFSDGHLARHLRALSADTLIFAGLHLHAVSGIPFSTPMHWASIFWWPMMPGQQRPGPRRHHQAIPARPLDGLPVRLQYRRDIGNGKTNH